MSSQFVHIDSYDRINPSESSGNFSVIITDLGPNDDKIMSIERVIMPLSMYAINATNQTFLINAVTVTLTPGNYTSATFVTELDTQLAANSVAIGATISSTISSITGKIMLTANAGDFTVTVNSHNNRYLGMVQNTAVASASSVFISPNVIELTVSRYIDVLIETPISSTNTTNGNRNIIARIPLVNAPFTTVSYAQSDFNFVNMLTRNFNTFRVHIVDQYQNTIDLNGLDWSLTLNIKSITDKNLN